MIVIGLMAGSAWAGIFVAASTAAVDAPSVPVVYAQEMVNASLSTRVPNGLISIELAAGEALPIANGYSIRFDLGSGATFASTSPNYVLANQAAGTLVIAAPLRTSGGQGSSFIEFSFNVTTAGVPNDNLTLTNNDPGGLRINNTALAVAGTSINCTITARNVGNVLQTTASLAFMNSTWGFETVTNSPGATGFVEVIAASSGRKQFRVAGVLQLWVNDATISCRTIPNTVQGDGLTAFALVAADRITLTITGDMSGVTNVWFDANNNGVLDVGERTATRTATTATFTGIPGGDPLIGVATRLAASVDGTTTLDNRIWTLASTLDMSDAAFNDHTNMTIRRTATAVVAGVVTLGIVSDGLYNWAHDGYMGIVPYLSTNATVPAVCVVNNSSTTAANVYLDVLSSEGAVVTSNLLLGPINALTTARLDFQGTNVTLAGSGIVPIPLMTADKRYAGRIVVTAAGASVYVTCLQTDPVTGKRVLPVLTQQPWNY